MTVRAFAVSSLFAAATSMCAPSSAWNPGDPVTVEYVEHRLAECLVRGSLCYGYAPIDPASTTNLALWLKADTLSQVHGSPVNIWADSSGNGRDASQGSPPNQPLFNSTGVPFSVIRFTASNFHYFTTSEFMDSSAVTMFHVAGNFTSTGADQRLFNDQGNTAPEWVFARVNSLDEYGFGARDGASNVIFLADPPAGTYSILTGELSDSSILFAQNGNEQNMSAGAYNTSTTWQGTNGPPTIGGKSNNPTADNFNGDLAEVIVFTRALTSDERRGIQCYLSAKYSIAVSHPCLSP